MRKPSYANKSAPAEQLADCSIKIGERPFFFVFHRALRFANWRIALWMSWPQRH